MPKKIFIFLITISLIVFGFLIINFRKAEEIEAGVADNMSGWAWSENIGWISFNCNNSELPEPRCVNDYGVNIDENIGDPSGYAWSENIGWIKFDPAADFNTGLYPGNPQYPACFDAPATGQVCDGVGVGTLSGWARACAGTVNRDCNSSTRTDGWDGWIKLRCHDTECLTSDYGVWLDTSINPYEFKGFAWGSNVVGWISFNDLNTGAPVDYQVITSIVLNFPPTASNLSWSDKYCDVQPGVGQVSFQWLYEDPENSNQSGYHLQIATDSGFTTKVIDCEIPSAPVPSGSYGSSAVKVVSSPSNVCNDGGLLGDRSLEINYRGFGNPYYWRIKVKDGIKWSSDWIEGASFDTPSHAYPWVDFNKCPLSSTVDEIVQFCSVSEPGVCGAGDCPLPTPVETTCYDIDGLCNIWEWDFDGDDVIDSTTSNPEYPYPTSGDFIIRLEVFDGDGFSCSHTEDMVVTLPIPKWREVAPF